MRRIWASRFMGIASRLRHIHLCDAKIIYVRTHAQSGQTALGISLKLECKATTCRRIYLGHRFAAPITHRYSDSLQRKSLGQNLSRPLDLTCSSLHSRSRLLASLPHLLPSFAQEQILAERTEVVPLFRFTALKRYHERVILK